MTARTRDKNSNSGVMIRKLLPLCTNSNHDFRVSLMLLHCIKHILKFSSRTLAYNFNKLNKRLSFMHTKTAIAPKNSSRCSDKSHNIQAHAPTYSPSQSFHSLARRCCCCCISFGMQHVQIIFISSRTATDNALISRR